LKARVIPGRREAESPEIQIPILDSIAGFRVRAFGAPE
jgi:hypothetical protein